MTSKKKNLEELKHYLRNFNRENCPEPFYCAWKILILRTTEYEPEKIYNELNYSLQKLAEQDKE